MQIKREREMPARLSWDRGSVYHVLSWEEAMREEAAVRAERGLWELREVYESWGLTLMNNEVSERGKGGVFHENFEKIYQDLPRRSWTEEVTHSWQVFMLVLDRRGMCSREYHVMLGPMWYHHVNDIIHARRGMFSCDYHVRPSPTW